MDESSRNSATISPELAARITSASAVLADYRREDAEFISGRDRMPDYVLWSVRLASELDMLLHALGGER